jgi:signal transduction histidine kinase
MTEPHLQERLAVVVHEVRSPVAALVAIAEAFAAGGLDGDERRELATLASSACHGIARLAGDAALASVRLERVDPERLVREAARAASLRGARVRVLIEPGLPVLAADPLRLRQALDNLLANAVAFAPAESQVTVAASTGDGRVRLSVSDRGPGIAPADQERIFAPGVRLEARSPGSGLGLWIARAIAQAHGGTLTVESAPGGGATFTLDLPVAQG